MNDNFLYIKVKNNRKLYEIIKFARENLKYVNSRVELVTLIANEFNISNRSVENYLSSAAFKTGFTSGGCNLSTSSYDLLNKLLHKPIFTDEVNRNEYAILINMRKGGIVKKYRICNSKNAKNKHRPIYVFFLKHPFHKKQALDYILSRTKDGINPGTLRYFQGDNI